MKFNMFCNNFARAYISKQLSFMEEETLTVFNKRVLNMFKLWTVQCA